MRLIEKRLGWHWLISKEAILAMWLPTIGITILHYSTEAAHHYLHDIFRRLYYIPIVLGAFLGGRRGALTTSISASLLYLPHAYTHMFHADPARTIEKFLEILLYNIVALITGSLADRQYRTAIQLQASIDELKIKDKQLIRAGRLQALGELTAGLAHEIKNPLASLKGATQIISDEIPDSSPRRAMIDILHREIDRLHLLLERFLDFAQPKQYPFGPIDLGKISLHICTLVETQAASKKVSIECRTSDQVLVDGNEESIIQVIFNLVLNAIQFSKENGSILITCAGTKRGIRPYGKIEVVDQGPGVAEENREKIFNPFFSTRAEGSGLGLSIANRIVDEHDGLIEVESNNGQGAVFRVLIPVKAQAADSPNDPSTFF